MKIKNCNYINDISVSVSNVEKICSVCVEWQNKSPLYQIDVTVKCHNLNLIISLI